MVNGGQSMRAIQTWHRMLGGARLGLGNGLFVGNL